MSTLIRTISPLPGAPGVDVFPDTVSTPSSLSPFSSPPIPMPFRSPLLQSTKGMAPSIPPNHIGAPSFFDEAIGSSPATIQGRIDTSVMPLPQSAPSNGSPQLQIPGEPLRQPKQKRNRKPANPRFDAAEAGTSAPAALPLRSKRRGRKPKSVSRGHGDETSDEYEGSQVVAKDPRRRRILQRNRVAATKCRLRKRDEATALATREQAMEDENRYLSSCFDSLTAEIYHLKTQLLRHTDCNCVLIQKYIANEAHKSVNGLSSNSPGIQPESGSMSAFHRNSNASASSVANSLSVHTLDLEYIPLTWANPLNPGSKPDIGDDIYDMSMDSDPKRQLLVSTQSMASLSALPTCDTGLFVGMSQQPPIMDALDWESAWEFR